MTAPTIRAERPGDEAAIRRLTEAAFAGVSYSDGSEPAIVDALRADGDLALSLVAETDGVVIAHVAFSPAILSNGEPGWLTLGPISVAPARQGSGIGRALIEDGIARLRQAGAAGIVLVGSVERYARFGFVRSTRLQIEGPLAEYFQVLAFSEAVPAATVEFAPGFAPERATDG